MYQDMINMDPSVENLKFHINALLLPLEDAPGSQFSTQLTSSTLGSDNNCVKAALLDAYCALVDVGVGEGYISALSFLKSFKFDSVVAAASSTAPSTYRSV